MHQGTYSAGFQTKSHFAIFFILYLQNLLPHLPAGTALESQWILFNSSWENRSNVVYFFSWSGWKKF